MDDPTKYDSQLRFARRSETESVCIFCSTTIRTDRYRPLEDAEDIHADVCLVKPDSSVRYVLL